MTDLKRNIEDFDLVFLDLETTGLDVLTGDAICEIGAFKVKEREIIDKFHSLVNPRKSMPKQAFRIHKISDDDLKDAPYFKEIADKLTLFLENSVICAYNVGFDAGFINHHLKAMENSPLDLPAIDILSMARDVLNLPRYNLGTTANFFNIDHKGRLHRALEDALIAKSVFFELMDIFKEKKLERLEDFISLYGLNNEIFKEQEDKKTNLIKKAIDKKASLDLRYFSSEKCIEREKIMPLRIFYENKHSCLLYQKSQGDIARTRLTRILEVGEFQE